MGIDGKDRNVLGNPNFKIYWGSGYRLIHVSIMIKLAEMGLRKTKFLSAALFVLNKANKRDHYPGL